MCAVCYHSYPNSQIPLMTDAKMVVNGLSVCLVHVGVARISTNLEEAMANVNKYIAVAEKLEDNAIEARRVGY